MSTNLFHREISEVVERYRNNFPVVVVTGARQVGKTSLLTGLFPNYHYISLDLPADAQLAEEDPQEFIRQNPPPVIVDEVQYAPKLFRHIKTWVDRNREAKGRFILTGSQKFTLMREVSDSLAGRCGVLELETLSRYELGTVFDQVHAEGIETILTRGFFPELWKEPSLNATDFYRSYLATYLERDVRLLININSQRDFHRFIRGAAIRSGQILNKNDLAKDVGVTAKTINHWLSVLEASNQITILEPYYTNLGKRLVKSPKIYFNDVGLLCFLLGLSRDTVGSSHLIGHIWETFVFAELRKWALLSNGLMSLWFYRDQSREVDFIIDRDQKPMLVDAKWTQYPDPKDFRQLIAVQKLFSASSQKLSILCRTPNPYPVKDHLIAANGVNVRNLGHSLVPT